MKLSEQGLVVYKAMFDQMDFLKKQQWVITNYLVLIYGAIYWLGSNVKPISDPAKWGLALLIFAACACGVILLVIIQYDLGQARLRINETDDLIFETEEYSALRIVENRGPHYFFRRFSFLIALIGVSVFGAVLLICSLWH